MVFAISQASDQPALRLSLHLSKCYIVGYHMVSLVAHTFFSFHEILSVSHTLMKLTTIYKMLYSTEQFIGGDQLNAVIP